MGSCKKYPEGMEEFIRDNSWGVSAREMAERCNEKFGTNWTTNGMKQYRFRKKIKSGVTGHFKKGCVSYTKGKKQEEYCSPEAFERAKKTRFQKGNHPARELPLGTIRTVKEGYKHIKISMTGGQWERWEPLHRYVWEKHYGEIPAGMVVTFRDGNALNCDINNLTLISREEHIVMCKKKLRSDIPELTDVGIQVARLICKTSQIKKGKRNVGKTEEDRRDLQVGGEKAEQIR